jgi:hypothetical protein
LREKKNSLFIWQFNAKPTNNALSKARLFNLGLLPGIPKQVSQTELFGSLAVVGQPQNNLLSVFS